MLKSWGIGDLIEEKGIPFDDTDYNTIETIDGLDKVNQDTQNRVIGNLFDNQSALKDFLETFSSENFSGNKIFSTGHTHAFEQTTQDAVSINLGSMPAICRLNFTISGWVKPSAGTYFIIPATNTNYVFWYQVSGSGAAPALGVGYTNVMISILTADAILTVANKTQSAIQSSSAFYTSLSQDSETPTVYYVTVQNIVKGLVSNASNVGTTLTITQIQTGIAEYWQSYVRIKPGLAFIEGNIVSNYPDLRIAERQLAKALDLNTVESEESINISYDESADTYDCIINKFNGLGTLVEYTYSDKTSAISLLYSIYNDFSDEILYATQLGADYSYVDFSVIKLEYSKKITTNDLYYSGIKITDGVPEISIQLTEFGVDDVKIASFNSLSVNLSGFNILSITDLRMFYPGGFNSIDEFLFFNAAISDTSGVLNPYTDASVDYSTLVNKDAHIIVLNQDAGANNNAVISYIKTGSTIAGWDDTTTDETHEDIFYFNKDIIIKNVDNSTFSLRDLKDAEFGIKTIDIYSNLPTGQADGTTYLVKDVNSFYRYNLISDTWIPVSDPHRQVYGFAMKKLGSDGTGTGNRTFNFGDINFKTDGSNVNIFKNGLFQILSEDYTITSNSVLQFDASVTIVSGDVIVAQIIRGGEEYYPEFIIYTSGSAEGNYTGGERIFETGGSFQLMIGNNKVFRNGVLQMEGEVVLTSTATATGSITTLEDTGVTDFNTENI
jgi:hypothetical protein